MTSCPLDVTYFPWDYQHCKQEFGSWNYNAYELDIVNDSAGGDIEHFIDEGEWVIKGMPVHYHLVVYSTGPYPTLVYTVIIERKPLYYIINIVLPTIFITVCGLLVFWLPPDSGEKVSLSVTILLASTVFMLVIGDNMPPQSSTVPLVGKTASPLP